MKGKILSVLIVDDEIPIRQELSMLNWEKLDTILVGESENGKKALEFCREYVPDVVITDITMPVMDGLELFRNLKSEFPQIQVIMLTCHSDFNYAKEAIKLGAVDYIVKVLMEEEDIRKALVKARDNIEREQSYIINFKEKQRSKLSRLVEELYAASTDTPFDFRKRFAHFNVNISYPVKVVYLHIISRPSNWIFIDQEISKYLDDGNNVFLWFPAAIGVYGFIYNCFTEKNEEFFLRIKEFVSDLSERLISNMHFLNGNMHMFATVCNTARNDIQLHRALLLRESWNNIAFYNFEQLVWGEGAEECKTLDTNLKQDIKKLLADSRSLGTDLVVFIRDTFRNWAYMNKVLPNELKSLVIELFRDFDRMNEYDNVISLKILQSDNLDELIEVLIHELGLNQVKRGSYRIEVRKAIKIIYDELEQPLTLTYVADKVAFSPSYLSKIFYDEVGEAFNDYVTRIRMEKAIYLLQSTNLKVYEVAEKVGIPNYRYFSTIFRNLTGITPKDYKKG